MLIDADVSDSRTEHDVMGMSIFGIASLLQCCRPLPLPHQVTYCRQMCRISLELLLLCLMCLSLRFSPPLLPNKPQVKARRPFFAFHWVSVRNPYHAQQCFFWQAIRCSFHSAINRSTILQLHCHWVFLASLRHWLYAIRITYSFSSTAHSAS